MKELALKLLWRVPAYSLLALCVFSFLFFRLYSKPRRHVTPVTPGDHGLAYEPVSFESADGIRLDGWFLPRKGAEKAVIVCHGYPMDKGNVLTMTKFLARDFAVLYFDFRGHGKSGAARVTGGQAEAGDVEAAALWLKGRGFSSIGAFGFSMGGSAVIMADTPLLRARVCDSPFADVREILLEIFSGWGPLRRPLVWAVSAWGRLLAGTDPARTPLSAAASCGAPLLLIHGDKDSQVPVSSSERLHAACPGSRLWIVKGADHGEACGYAAPAYEREITAFLKKHL